MFNLCRKVELMGCSDQNSLIDLFYEKSSGKYTSPYPPTDLNFQTSDKNYPPIAILDTGVMTHHPMIQKYVVESIDFTGEGFEDLNGHGTYIAFQGIRVCPNPKIINVKVLDKFGNGNEKWLIKGLKWCLKWAESHDSNVVANLSAGIYHRQSGIFKCQGECYLCKIARLAMDGGVFLNAAAGNNGPTKIPCPQQAILNDPHYSSWPPLYSVTASIDKSVDIEDGIYPYDPKLAAPYSGRGTTMTKEPTCSWHQL